MSILSNNIKVYPNPFSDRVQIEFELKTASEVQLSLYDNTGRILDVMSGHYGKGKCSIIMNTPEIPPGMYYIHLKADAAFFTYKLIKSARL